MYTQFEEAGLIVGTEEWEELMEQKYQWMMEEGSRNGMQRDDSRNSV